MLSTRFCVAHSFLTPCFEEVVEDTSATSTGRRSTVASREVSVNMQTMVTAADLSLGDW